MLSVKFLILDCRQAIQQKSGDQRNDADDYIKICGRQIDVQNRNEQIADSRNESQNADNDEQNAQEDTKCFRAAFQTRVNSGDTEKNMNRRVNSISRQRAENRIAEFAPNAFD